MSRVHLHAYWLTVHCGLKWRLLFCLNESPTSGHKCHFIACDLTLSIIMSTVPFLSYPNHNYRRFHPVLLSSDRSHLLMCCSSKLNSWTIQWRTQDFFRGGSTNSFEDRGQRELGSGGGSPLVRGFHSIWKWAQPVFWLGCYGRIFHGTIFVRHFVGAQGQWSAQLNTSTHNTNTESPRIYTQSESHIQTHNLRVWSL
jgi:hypothetical protein